MKNFHLHTPPLTGPFITKPPTGPYIIKPSLVHTHKRIVVYIFISEGVIKEALITKPPFNTENEKSPTF